MFALKQNPYFKKIKALIKEVADRIFRDHVGVFAAQASLFLVISFLPLVMLLIAVMQFVIPFNREDVIRLVTSNVSPYIQGFVLTIVREIFDKPSVSLLSVTAVTTMWSASKGVMALVQGLDQIYRGGRESYLKERLTAILYTAIFLLVVVTSVGLMMAGKYLEGVIRDYAPVLHSALLFILNKRTVLFLIMIALFFTLVYTFLPGSKRKFKYQLPGGIFSAVGWMAFSKIYAIYIENFSNFSYVYGSLTAIVLLMLWLYFCMNIFLLGAELNVIGHEKREEKRNLRIDETKKGQGDV